MPMKHLIVGTAGHIDHGKSALVKALTGIDPDRLKEEKERGLTIDLGFAYFDLSDGTRIGFVDVPGHERFVKNMLAGAAGMDIVILVVDATESVMPQTREHLDIMKLLGISHGIIAVTKVDIADSEMVDIVEAEIEDLVRNTFLQNAPIVRISSKTGRGLDEIKALIAEAVSKQQQKDEEGLFRFPIDRVFTMKGFGTVVTGTVFSGRIGEDEPVVVLPQGLASRARQLQSHNVKVESISAGMRAALNLANLSVQQLKRGDTLVRPGTVEATEMIDAKVRLLASAPRDLRRISSVKFYVATDQRMARMTIVERNKLSPGEECYAQLRLSQPVCLFRGDRFVLRGESPEFTIGGGFVLDVAPAKLKRKDTERPQWLRVLETTDSSETALAFLSQKRMGMKLQELAMRTGQPIDTVRSLIDDHAGDGGVLSTGWENDMLLISRENFEQMKKSTTDELLAFFRSQPHRLFMSREELRSRLGSDLPPQLFEKILEDLVNGKHIDAAREGVTIKGRAAQTTEAQKSTKEKIENIFLEAGFSPPTLSQAEEQGRDPKTARQMISLLIEEGTLIKISPTLAYHKNHLEQAFQKIRNHFSKVEKLGVGDLKTVLDVSRKHAVPLLEYFDKIGFTIRVGDNRVLKEKTAK